MPGLLIPTLLVAALCAGTLTACGESTRADVPDVYRSDLSVPGNLLENLVLSHLRREVGPYGDLLAHDYRFFLQPQEDSFPGDLTRAQDLASTGAMFLGDDVTRVELAMEWGDPEDVVLLGEPAKQIVVTDLVLEVERAGITYRLVDEWQHFYFVPGDAEEGEDPDRYYLVEWHDIGAPRAPGDAGATEGISWSRIKVDFLPDPE